MTLDQALEERRKNGVDVEGMAEEIGKAESLRDLTDTLAETLFGDEEFEEIAAQVVANPPPGKAAPGKSAPNKTIPGDTAPSVAAAKDPSLRLELVDDLMPAESGDAEAPGSDAKSADGVSMSTTRRLDLVLKLNSGGKIAEDTENIEMGESGARKKPEPASKAGPAPIEEQINTEMTATLKQLSAADGPPTPAEEDEPKEKKSGGLFSRFGRSS